MVPILKGVASMKESQTEGRASLKTNGVNRRTIIKGAAWSVPVIAAVSAAPLAAASAGQAIFNIGVGSQINVNPGTETANGTLNGSLNISNVIGTWETDTLTASYRFTGPWTATTLTGPSGTFAVGQTYGIWTVSSIGQDETGMFEVDFTAPSQTITADTTITLPSASYTGTFSGATVRNPIGANVAFSSAVIRSLSNSSNYPAR